VERAVGEARRRRPFTAALVPAGAIGIGTAVDYYTPGLSGWPIALLIVLPILAWLLALPSRARVLTLLAAAAWSVLLPAVPWHSYKRFYMDCARIEQGASLEDVRALMAAYQLQYDVTAAGTPRPDGLALLFHPSLSRSADWCLIYGKGGSVARVEISPD
jgi:hypothetical protein